MVKERQGNVLYAEEDVIAHQVNCYGRMDTGVSKEIRNKLLSIIQFHQHQRMCEMKNTELLGSCQIMKTVNEKYVANLFAEVIPVSRGGETDYDALEQALWELQSIASENQLSIALPAYLGCGQTGGDWETAYQIIKKVFEGSRTKAVIYYQADDIRRLWEDFGDVQMDPVTEGIESEWHDFPVETHRELIWHWFEETFHISVAHDLIGTC